MKLSNSNHCPWIKTQKQVEVWVYATSLSSTSRSVCNFLHKQKCMQLPSQAEAEVYARSLTSTSGSICSVTHKHRQKCMQLPSQAQAEVYATSLTNTSGSVRNFLHKQNGIVACRLTKATTHPTAMLLSFVRRFI